MQAGRKKGKSGDDDDDDDMSLDGDYETYTGDNGTEEYGLGLRASMWGKLLGAHLEVVQVGGPSGKKKKKKPQQSKQAAAGEEKGDDESVAPPIRTFCVGDELQAFPPAGNLQLKVDYEHQRPEQASGAVHNDCSMR